MSQEKIRKHKIYDHPIIGTIVGMILAIIAYSLLIGLILPIFVEKNNTVATSFARIIGMMIFLLFHQFYFRDELKDLFKIKGLKKGILLGWSILIVSSIIFIVNHVLGGEPMGSVPYAILCGIVPGLSEEVVFRIIPLSIAMRKIKDNNKLLVPCLITSLPFGLMHLANIFVGADTGASIIQMLYAIAIGMLLAGIYVKTKNMWSIVFLHSLQDIVSFLSVSSQQNNGVLVESNSTIEIVILLCFTITFYINAIYVWRNILKK